MNNSDYDLDLEVGGIIGDFIASETLFTALDVSKCIKQNCPGARHKEVRDMVRSMYPQMQKEGYTRTPITVKLEDGSQVEALLYHPLSDSWDLDEKYSAQQRGDKPAAQAQDLSSMPDAHEPPQVSVISKVHVAVQAPAVTITSGTRVHVSDAKQLWDSLLSGSKLFPRQ